MEYSNGTAEAYRYPLHHHAPASYDTSTFVGQANAYCGSTNLLPPPPSSEEFHPTTTRRFHPYLATDPSSLVGAGAVVGPGPGVNATAADLNNGGHYRNGFSTSPHQCDQCGSVFDSPHGLAEHVHHHHFVASFPPDVYPPPPPSSHIKTELNGGNETAEILDLDSHKVHVYQPPGSVMGLTPAHHHHPGGPLAPTPPYTPATSVGSASNSSSMGWMTPTPPLAPPPPLHAHDYRPNPFPAYELPVNGNNSTNLNSATNGNGPPITKSAPAGWKPNPPPTGGPPPSGGGNHGGGSEARRPKTYNCEACNKWFTSSGHLKRHYNTTLHKNAIKASGGATSTNGNGNSNGEGRRSTTPSSRSTGTPTGAVNSPAGSDETSKHMDDLPMPRSSPKMIPSSPGNGDYRPPSQQPLPPPLIHHQQQQLQSAPLSVAQQNNNNGYPPVQQQQPQQMDPYRYPAPSMTAGSSGPPPPNGGHLPYYCPPPIGHSSYSPYPQQQQQQQHLQQQQQQHVYPQSNTMGYPPNSIAPPPSSNANVQQLGVGPTASSRSVIHQQQQQQQHYHLNHDQPFNINNNNTIMEHNNKMGVEFNGHDSDSYALIKSNESDCSGGGSDGSPAGSDDADLDLSDVEEGDHQLTPMANVDIPEIAELAPVAKSNGGAVKSRSVAVTTDSGNGTGSVVGSFKCTQCDKAFNRVCYLTQHNNTFHKGDKPFKCHMCGKRFPNAELFDQHQQKHAGDKPYKCPLCPKQFNHKTDLRRHMCLHTGQKPFMCQVCSKGFIRKDHMVKHVQTHTRRNALHAHPPPSAS